MMSIPYRVIQWLEWIGDKKISGHDLVSLRDTQRDVYEQLRTTVVLRAGKLPTSIAKAIPYVEEMRSEVVSGLQKLYIPPDPIHDRLLPPVVIPNAYQLAKNKLRECQSELNQLLERAEASPEAAHLLRDEISSKKKAVEDLERRVDQLRY